MAEQRAWLRTTVAARAEAIADIVTGRETDARRAERRLRHSLARHHLAVAAWIDPRDDGDAQDVLEPVLTKAAACLGADTVLAHALGLHASVVWLSRAAPFDPDALDRIASEASPAAGARLALGEPGTALNGFRRTYTEAVHARRVASLIHAAPGSITRYADVAVAAMASLDLDQAAVFVHRVLGDLARGDEPARRCADTLAVYLEENGSRARTGQRLGFPPQHHQVPGRAGRAPAGPKSFGPDTGPAGRADPAAAGARPAQHLSQACPVTQRCVPHHRGRSGSVRSSGAGIGAIRPRTS